MKHSSFDGRGNYTLGIADINDFLEVEAQHGNMLHFNLNSARGVGITLDTNCETDEEAKLFLSALRFPFSPILKAPPRAK